MKIKEIMCFNALASTLNFTKAAGEQFISQPAFSRIIMSMEEELGGSLFVRDKKRPQLTLLGERILENTLRIQEEYEEIQKKADLFARNDEGSLRIAFMPNSIPGGVREVIRDFGLQFPHVLLSLQETVAINLFSALDAFAVDAAVMLCHMPEMTPEMYERVTLGETPHCLVVHREHRLAGRDSVEISELKSESFVVLQQDKFSYGMSFFNRVFQKADITPHIAATANSLGNILTCVSCQVGCSLLTGSMSDQAPDDVVFVPVSDIAPCRTLLIWKKENSNPALGEFLKMLKKSV